MARKIIIGVMGPGEGASESIKKTAYQMGKLIALNGWVLLTGGRSAGVMESATKGAKAGDGLTIGILPDRDQSSVSESVDLAIITDLGNARNNVNVLTSEVIIACGMGLGTASEVALALKNSKPVIFLDEDIKAWEFFRQFAPKEVFFVTTPAEAVEIVKTLLKCN